MFKINEDGTMEIIRGDSGEFEIKLYRDEYGEEEYQLQEGDTLFFTVKKNTKTEEVLIQKSGPLVMIDPEDTADLPYGKYKYDVEFTFASGYVDTVVPPTLFSVKEEVTF